VLVRARSRGFPRAVMACPLCNTSCCLRDIRSAQKKKIAPKQKKCQKRTQASFEAADRTYACPTVSRHPPMLKHGRGSWFGCVWGLVDGLTSDNMTQARSRHITRSTMHTCTHVGSVRSRSGQMLSIVEHHAPRCRYPQSQRAPRRLIHHHVCHRACTELHAASVESNFFGALAAAICACASRIVHRAAPTLPWPSAHAARLLLAP